MLKKDELDQLDNLIAARNKTLLTLIIGSINSVKVELKSEIHTAKIEVKKELRKDIQSSEDRLRKDMAAMEKGVRNDMAKSEENIKAGMATKKDIERLEVKIDRTNYLQKQLDIFKERLDELESRFGNPKSKN
jgi:RNA polymerase-binding transcription factor DksA